MPETIDNCVLCGTKGRPDDILPARIGLKPPFGIMKCPACGMRWQSPRPTQSELFAFYEHVYFDGPAPHTDVPEWMNTYAAPPARNESQEKLHQATRTAQVAHHLAMIGSPQPPADKLLELGCSEGRFLEQAHQTGWDCLGVEPSQSACETARAKGLDVRHQTLEEFFAVNHTCYDCIVMSHVFEHIHDPVACARELYSALNKDGVLLIEVPNQYASWIDRLATAKHRINPTERPSTVLSIHHTNFFTPQTLYNCLSSAGFDVTISSWVPSRPTDSIRDRAINVIDKTADRIATAGRNLQALCRKK